MLGFHNYNEDSGPWYRTIFYDLRYVFVSYYTVESIFKIIARGLYQDRNSYLRDPNNFIHFTIVILTLAIDKDFVYCFIFRLFYILMLFTKITYLDYGRKILDLLYVTLDALVAILFLLFFFMSLFAILGTNLWAERLDRRCRLA